MTFIAHILEDQKTDDSTNIKEDVKIVFLQ